MCNINVLQGGFPGDPVVKNPPSNARGVSSIPGQGTKIPHAAGHLSPSATTPGPVCSSVHTPQLEKMPVCCNEDPAQPQFKQINNYASLIMLSLSCTPSTGTDELGNTFNSPLDLLVTNSAFYPTKSFNGGRKTNCGESSLTHSQASCSLLVATDTWVGGEGGAWELWSRVCELVTPPPCPPLLCNESDCTRHCICSRWNHRKLPFLLVKTVVCKQFTMIHPNKCYVSFSNFLRSVLLPSFSG